MRYARKLAHWSLVMGSIMLPGLCSSQTAQAAQVTATWIGPGGLGGDGNWSVASNWSGNVVPNNGFPAGTTYNVLIDGSGPGAIVTLSDGHATVDALTTSPGDTLDIRLNTSGTSLKVVNTGAGTGTITNAGTITLNGEIQVDLLLNGEVTLTGGGTVRMINQSPTNAGNSIRSLQAGSRLINANNTISGAGSIGSSELALTNQATITADASPGLKILAANTATNFNAGTLRAVAGNTLTIITNITNTGGTVRVDSNAGNSIVHLIRGVIVGGTVELIGAGAGELRLDNQNTGASSISGGTVTNNATGTIRNIQRTNELGGNVINRAGGQIIINDASILILAGGAGNSYRNVGNIALNAAASTSTLRIEGEVTLTGGGTVTMSNHAGNSIRSTVLNARLINANNSISGAGSIGDGMAFTNRGTLRADQSTPLIVNVFPSATGFITSGRVQINAGSVLAMGSGDIFTQTAGTTTVNGTLTLTGSTTLALQAGFLNGTGTVNGKLNNSGGRVSPGPTTSVLSETGNYVQGANGGLRIDLNGATAGTEYDQLNVSGTVSLNGRLILTNGFNPPTGTSFTILNNDGTDAVAGAFNNLPEGSTLRIGVKVFRISYAGGDGNDVVLTRIRPTLSISDATVTEGDAGTKNIVFTVTLSEAISQTVKVDFTTEDVLATAPADYIAKSGTVGFLAGTTTRSIIVAVQGDTVQEATERFRVRLSNPISASLADAIGSGTIIDNDSPSAPST